MSHNDIDIFDFNEWDHDSPSVRARLFDELSDDEILAMPADLIMDVFRRTSQGGLVVESGDETASVEIVKRIPDYEMKPIDIVCTVNNEIAEPLPEIDNPYCNTEWAFDYVPPRIPEPRLPVSSNTNMKIGGVQFDSLTGLARCLASAVEAVAMQRKEGGDATILADYYAAFWELPIDFFMGPILSAEAAPSDVDLISAYDNREYLTYIDPAWQAIVRTNRPVLDLNSFGPRAMIHWDRVFYLARLQMIKGLMADQRHLRDVKMSTLIFRIDSQIVHQHHERPHTIRLPPGLLPTHQPNAQLKRYFHSTVVPKVREALEAALSADITGLTAGSIGALYLVAPTTPVRRVKKESGIEIAAVQKKVREHFDKVNYTPTPGINPVSVSMRILDKALEGGIQEVHLLSFNAIMYLVRLLEDYQNLSVAIRRLPSGIHAIAYALGNHIGSVFGDSRVLGYLRAVGSDSTRERGQILDKVYVSTFGHKWQLPGMIGQYARLVQLIAYMAMSNVCYGSASGYGNVAGQVVKTAAKMREALHRGAMIGSPLNVAHNLSHYTHYRIHEHLTQSLRRVYGRILEYEAYSCHLLLNQLRTNPKELVWIYEILITQRALLGCIKDSKVDGGHVLIVARDEERRVLISFIQHVTYVDYHIEGSVENVWQYAKGKIQRRPFISQKTLCKIASPTHLESWFEEQFRLHRGDHDQLEAALNEAERLPEESPYIRPEPPSEVDDAVGSLFTGKEIAAPVLGNQMAMWNQLYSLTQDEDTIERIDGLEAADYTIEEWAAALGTARSVGVNAAINQLTARGAAPELH